MKYYTDRPKKVDLIILITILTFSLLTLHATAAVCPAQCLCLNTSTAKGGGYVFCGGNQSFCGYDQYKNPMYCYQNPTIIAAQPKLIPIATVTTTPAPGAPVSCPTGCECALPATAQQYGYSFCNGKQTVCGYEQTLSALIPKYCYQKPPQTTQPSLVTCPDTCTCLSLSQGTDSGYARCSVQTNPCGYDQYQNYKYCYEKSASNTCQYDYQRGECTGSCQTGAACHLNTIIRDLATGSVTFAECTCKAPSPTDKEPPVIDLIQTPFSAKANETVTITVRATDPNGVAKIELYIDGKKVSDCLKTQSCSFSTILPEGDTTLAAQALDELGNLGRLSRVTKITRVSIPLCPIVRGTINGFNQDINSLKINAEQLGWLTPGIGGIPRPIEITVETRVFDVVSPREFELTYSTDCLSEGTWRIEPVYSEYSGTSRWRGNWSPKSYTIVTSESPLGKSDAHFTFTDPCTSPTLPSQFDWREWEGTNWVSPVKDQMTCGSCWAFSTVGMVEAIYNVEQNRVENLDLSEQNLVSNCYPQASCKGREASVEARLDTLRYVTENGIVEEACFPYQSGNCCTSGPSCVCDPSCSCGAQCTKPCSCERCADWSSRLWKTSYYHRIGGDQNEIKRALICRGPVQSCGGGHCVVIIGWNNEHGNWIIKNSWGTGWEDNGFGELPFNYQWFNDTYYIQGVRRG